MALCGSHFLFPNIQPLSCRCAPPAVDETMARTSAHAITNQHGVLQKMNWMLETLQLNVSVLWTVRGTLDTRAFPKLTLTHCHIQPSTGILRLCCSTVLQSSGGVEI